jgi:diguanylate cyclase (GGDEF)-like protein/PAS domain S-box-containing protein
MPDIIEEETLPFDKIAPVAGFFTYGEFFTSSNPELLNQSMTLVSLSENDTMIKDVSFYENPSIPVISSTNALINLVNVTSTESMKKEMFINTQSIFETLFRTSPDGILLIENEVLIETNQKMIDIFGYASKEEFLKLSPLDMMAKRQADRGYSLIALSKMKHLAENDEIQEFEWLAQKADGSTFWTDILLTPIELSDRKLLYVVCRDISEKKATELEILRQKDTLYHQAYHDDLTGLPNRTLFMIELKKSLEEAKIEKTKRALVFIDLDRFKQINDSLGHLMGDQVIMIVAKRLRLVISANDMVARLGGDEFLILLKDVETEEALIKKVEKILKISHEPMFIESHRLYSSASIGISHYPQDDTDADNLLKYADAAMYKAKEEGGNNFQFYLKEMTASAYENVMMERDLRESIKAKDFEVYYQPQIQLQTGLIIGAEALVRWNHPTVGFLSPDMFIALAIKTGLIIELDLWVMDTAMKDFAKWYKEGLTPGLLALNVNMQQLESSAFIDDVMKSIKRHQFQYSWLECELTETEVMKNPIKVIKILKELHDLGITIAIDDFGTGYSSLSYLKRLPIDKLKIDQSFIQDIGHDETAMAIVNTIIVLAQSLNLKVIAEGVETYAQEQFLAKHGCHQAQGFYYAKPLPAKDFKALLQKQKLSSD